MSTQDEIKSLMLGTSYEEAEDDEQISDDPERTQETDEEEAGTEVESGEAEEDSRESEQDQSTSEEAEETLEQRYARLLTDLNTANAKLMEIGAQHPHVQHSVQQPEPPVAQQLGQPVELPEFKLDPDLVNKALIESDVDAFGKILTAVATHAVAVSEAHRVNTLRSVPEMATQMALQRVRLQSAVDAFYSSNDDLLPHSATVGMITNQVVAENPQFGLQEVFTEVEKRARKTLGLKRKVEVAQQSSGRKNFAGKSGSRKPGAQTLTGLRGEIAAMQTARR
jgi:hypothetical protein